MKANIILFFALLLFITGCNSVSFKGNRKYKVKSGIITYETQLKTISVKLNYMTLVYFDDYGLKERRDTYDNGQLKESFMSDGKSLYQLSHLKKTAYRTGAATHGTEAQFNWDKVTKEEKDSGTVIKLPNEIIAGKDCEIYFVKATVATARYGGWKNINMLSEITSPGGTSLMKAINIEIIPVDKERFELPPGYTLQ